MESQRKMIVWKNGLPTAATEKPFTKETINALTRATFALPYETVKDADGKTLKSEEKFEGLSIGEVMVQRACEAAAKGDLDAFKYLMDRVAGKPVQAVENVNISASLEEFLEAVARQGLPQSDHQQITVTVDDVQEIPSVEDLLKLL